MNKLPIISIVKPVLPDFDDINHDLQQVLASGILTKGRYLLEFEKVVAEHLGVRHTVAVSSCTSGLMLAYQASGLKDGEAIVPSFTFMATISALIWAGGKPVFAETDRQTFNVIPKSVEEKITSRTKAIVAVHNFGNPAAIDELEEIAKRHNLKLIFDAAHAFGTLYKGSAVGSQGDIQVFSLSPTKLVTAGEGGIIALNDDELASRLRAAREYGNGGTYDCVIAGQNARLPEISALLGAQSLRLLESAVENRNHYADLYRARLGKLPGIGFQKIDAENRSSYKDFCITVNEDEYGLNRDQLAAALNKENIETRSYYNPPTHMQTAYRQFSSQNLPVTEQLAQECLSLPMWSKMEIETLERVCETITSIQQNSERIKDYLKTLKYLSKHSSQ